MNRIKPLFCHCEPSYLLARRGMDDKHTDFPKSLHTNERKSVCLGGAGTAVCTGNEAIPGPRRDGRAGLSPFLMHGDAGLPPPTPVKFSLGFTPIIKKGDCPLHSTTSGTVTPFDATPLSKALAHARQSRSNGACGLIKRGDSPPRRSLLGPGIASLPAHTAVPAPRNDSLGALTDGAESSDSFRF
jgi:hypothetical protein